MIVQKPKVKFVTLGCRVNQYETQGMREVLQKSGFQSKDLDFADPADGKPGGFPEADFVVINTCTVTGEADRQSRYWIRRARREYPKARIVVTGCGVEKDFGKMASLPEVDFVLSNHEKANIAGPLLANSARSFAGTSEKLRFFTPTPKGRSPYPPLSISQSEGRTRAFVKIQDGCNHACAFCKVMLVRGRSRSRKLSEIIQEVLRLRDSGYCDIVFTGIQVGAYGLDFGASHKTDLCDVLVACSKIDGIERLRLSSIEPTDVRPSLIRALRDIPQCTPHLHIPLQSGDDGILRRMNRRYRSSFYRELIERLRSVLPDFMLTLDVMAGFPGETEENFQNTARLLEILKPLKCHVFPYSLREGTRAAKFDGEIKNEIIRKRVRNLIGLGDRLAEEAMRPYRGRVMPVLIEKFRNSKQGVLDLKDFDRSAPGPKASRNKTPKAGAVPLQGLTANFMKVFLQGDPRWMGKIVPVELEALEKGVFFGKYAGDSPAS